MFRFTHKTLIALAGCVWLAVGIMLLSMGLNFIVESILRDNLMRLSRPILDWLALYVGGLDQAVLLSVGCALLIGLVKSRYVFSKSVCRHVQRLSSLPSPIALSQLYTKAYVALLGVMISLGILLRFVPLDVRGIIDVAIGAALINGAWLYFRQAWLFKDQKQTS